MKGVKVMEDEGKKKIILMNEFNLSLNAIAENVMKDLECPSRN